MVWIYFPEQQTATIDLAQLAGSFDVRWFDPATGQIQKAGAVDAAGSKQFSSPFAYDALLMLVPPGENETVLSDDMRRGVILGGGSLLVLILLYLVFRQVKAGVGR